MRISDWSSDVCSSDLEHIAAANGAQVELQIPAGDGTPVLVNDPALTARAHDSLVRAAGPGKVIEVDPITGAEDFADYANLVPSVFFFVGATPPDRDMKTVASNQDRKSTRLNSSH